MPKEEVRVYNEIGKVVFKRKRGIKRLTVRVKSSGEVTVTIPFLVSLKQAESFLLSKKDWVQQSITKIKESAGINTVFDNHSEFNTYRHILRIIRTDANKFSRKIRTPYIEIYIPLSVNIKSEESQLYIRESLTLVYRKEAHDLLPGRLNELANNFSFNYSGLSIKKMRSRWGSCSHKNRINLNLYLMALPEHLRDYVLLHELVHTVEKNHTLRFWNKLESICGEAKHYRKEIQKFNKVILA